jgi:hypothetical protein
LRTRRDRLPTQREQRAEHDDRVLTVGAIFADVIRVWWRVVAAPAMNEQRWMTWAEWCRLAHEHPLPRRVLEDPLLVAAEDDEAASPASPEPSES